MNIYYYLKEYARKRPVFMALIRAKEAYLFDKYKNFITEPTIDIGCGDGEFAKLVWGKIDTGIDLAGSRMKETKKGEVYKNLIEYDGVKIPVKSNYYQTALSNCVLEHAEHLEELLKEIYRVTKPGGYFLTTVMAQPWEDYLLGSRLLGKAYKDWFRKTQDHHNLLTAKQWDKAFETAGWKVREKTGYLPTQAGRLVEMWHYLSAGYLISYKLTGKWTWIDPTPILPIRKMADFMAENTEPPKSGAIFYILKK